MPQRRILFAFIILAVLMCGTAHAGYDFISRYTQEKFPYAQEANAILQTRDGYIWIGAYEGLLRYDGSSNVAFGKANGFKGGSVRDIFEASDGTLWIGSNDSGLYFYKDGVFKKIETNGLIADSIRSIAEDKDGNIFAASSAGVGFVDKDRNFYIIDDERLSKATVTSLVCDDDNRIWGVTSKGEIFALDKDRKVAAFLNKNKLASRTATGLMPKGDKLLIGTTENIIIEMAISDIISDTLFPIMKFYITRGLSSVLKFYEDRDGRTWTVAEAGVGFFDFADNDRYELVSGMLLNASMEKMFEDYEGNFWFASSRQGVEKLTKAKFQDLSMAYEIPETVVNATALWQNKLYLATDVGLLAVDNEHLDDEDPLVKLLDKIRVRCLLVDKENNLWAATYSDMGLIKFSPDGSREEFTQGRGLPSDRVRSLIEGKEGVIVATSDGVAVIKDEKVVKTYTKADGLATSTILSLYERPDGTILAGSDGGGIYILGADGSIKNLNKKDKNTQLSSGVILRIFGDEENGVLLVSGGSNVDILKLDDLSFINTVKIDAQAFEIEKTKNDEYVFAASNGLIIVPAADFLKNDLTDAKIYTKGDGLKSSSTPNSWSALTEDGSFYMSCTSGVHFININNIHKNLMAPKIAIGRILIDEKEKKTEDYSGKKLTIPANAARITFYFSVLSFCDSDSEVTYYLDGFDKSPITGKASALDSATYTNLKGGQYRFVLSAKNSDGVKCESDIIVELDKPTALKDHPLFIIVAAFAMIGGSAGTVWLIGKTRRDAILRRQHQYKEITSQAIKAIANTIDAKDTYTNGHSLRVANYSVAIAGAMDFDEDELENVYYTALLHDIGKIGVPDNILGKKERLNDDEYEAIKKHPAIGGEILKDMTVISSILEGAKYHHEKFDGTGYNEGVKGTDIPLMARIISVADTFDAMASDRPYRNGLSKTAIIEEFKRYSGTQFDPEIANLIIRLIEEDKI